MSNPAAIALKIAGGYAKAASKLGLPHNLYRPTLPLVPALDPSNFLRSTPFASSATPKGDFASPSKYGAPIRYALTDTRYGTDAHVQGDDTDMMLEGLSESAIIAASPVRPGDYVDGSSGTYFFASVNAFEIPMVVECNTVITVKRPAGQDDATDLTPGRHGYEAPTAANDRAILLSWPASVLDGGRTEASRPDLPGDVAAKGVIILLPATAVPILVMDRIEDGRQAYTVSSAELTALGWRLGASFSESI